MKVGSAHVVRAAAGSPGCGAYALFLTGAGGQLGHDLRSALDASGAPPEVLATDHAALDVADRDAVLGALTSIGPTSSCTPRP